MSLPVKRLTETALLPTRATDGSAGYDLYAVELDDTERNAGGFGSTGH